MVNSKNRDLDKLGHGFREWHPRIWHGMDFPAWSRLVYGRLGRIPLKRYPLAVSITFTSLLNSLCYGLSRFLLGRKISKVRFVESPVFVLGFWRSGTTWLNELLVLDPTACYPTTFQCFAPNSIMFSGVFEKLIGKIVPNKRPMDTVELGMKNPQEDEFAILNLGLESPYRYLAFPSLIYDEEFADEFWPKSQASRDIWAKKWRFFLKTIQYLNPNKRLVLKSPLHTARIEMILSVIPNAKFIHISRDPKSIIGSAQKTHEAMLSTQSLEYFEDVNGDVVEDTIKSLEEMYQAHFEQSKMLSSKQIAYLKYEDLRNDTAGELSRIYSTLNLGEFESVRHHFDKFIDSKKEYKPDVYELPDEVLRMISKKCKSYIRTFGYQL